MDPYVLLPICYIYMYDARLGIGNRTFNCLLVLSRRLQILHHALRDIAAYVRARVSEAQWTCNSTYDAEAAASCRIVQKQLLHLCETLTSRLCKGYLHDGYLLDAHDKHETRLYYQPSRSPCVHYQQGSCFMLAGGSTTSCSILVVAAYWTLRRPLAGQRLYSSYMAPLKKLLAQAHRSDF